MSENEEKPRKVRSDKGLVMATRRDLYCIAWIAEQYAARGDQIRRLLSRFVDPERPFQQGEMIAETTTRDQISRWKRAGWIEYRRVLADEPGYAWVTKRGLQLVGLDDIYTVREPAVTRLDHLYAVNQLRLWLDAKYAWQSERRWRSEATKNKKGKITGPIPDGVITTKHGRVAIEAEISAKKPDDVFEKLKRLTRHYDNVGYEYKPVFSGIWFYVPNERLKTLMEKAFEKLKEDEQRRVSVVIEDDLLSSRFQR